MSMAAAAAAAVAAGDDDSAVERFKLLKLIKSLEAARGCVTLTTSCTRYSVYGVA